jgi:hypothetical protein
LATKGSATYIIVKLCTLMGPDFTEESEFNRSGLLLWWRLIRYLQNCTDTTVTNNMMMPVVQICNTRFFGNQKNTNRAIHQVHQ